MIDRNISPYDLKKLEMYHPEVKDATHIYYEGYDLIVIYPNGSAFALDDVNDYYRKICESSKITEEELNAEFAYRFRRRRYISGLSSKQLAEQIGISESTISSYCSGKTIPRFHILDAIARILNCSIDEFRFIPRK